MKKSEEAAVVRLVRHMQELQRQLQKPSHEDATDEEVKLLFQMLWEWTDKSNQKLPSKHKLEKLVGLLRGCGETEYCYISRERVAGIVRSLAEEKTKLGSPLSVYLSKGWREMTDTELYEDGRWNYRETPLVELLWNMQANPHMFYRDGHRR